MSEGNGHPYSWSAIINGYNPVPMESCGFPAIPEYLSKQSPPDHEFAGVEVSSVFSQSVELSRHIAESSKIPNVAESLTQMANEVDAVLLARDDAENHMSFARPFLEHGLPLYVDKPVALSVSELDKLYSKASHETQIYSCSALRFARELRLTEDERSEIGDILQINGQTPKSWDKYAVHLIDPLLHVMGFETVNSTSKGHPNSESTQLAISWSNGVTSEITSTGGIPSSIYLDYVGTNGRVIKTFKDSYTAFKSALVQFVERVQTPCSTDYPVSQRVVELIEAGRK